MMLPMNTEKVKELFGDRLRELRKAVGFTQEELADAAELDRSYVGSVERGERNLSIDNVCRLAEAIGVSPAEFFSWWNK
ncbi:MAG: helix-turn-helix transcriptional regulator [Rhodopirellula sp.]|nr:helix-turn-helix transcriptional regulator [Rhodopirellula sp.]